MAYHAPQVSVRADMVAQADAIRQQWGLAGVFALCHIGGSYATKRLPEAHWRSLLVKLGRRQTTVVLWGSDDERDYARRVAANIAGVFAATARLPIATLAGLLCGGCGYIGPDSGVTHLAAAVGMPTVTMWGPTAPSRMGAVGGQHYDIVSKNECSPCFKRSCDQFVCMPSLLVENIYQVFLQAVASREGGLNL
ncbi:MAG: glycosyltransferase family 9 protein [Mariprofundales bacterium]